MKHDFLNVYFAHVLALATIEVVTIIGYKVNEWWQKRKTVDRKSGKG